VFAYSTSIDSLSVLPSMLSQILAGLSVCLSPDTKSQLIFHVKDGLRSVCHVTASSDLVAHVPHTCRSRMLHTHCAFAHSLRIHTHIRSVLTYKNLPCAHIQNHALCTHTKSCPVHTYKILPCAHTHALYSHSHMPSAQWHVPSRP
jgi:hypothetical protein